MTKTRDNIVAGFDSIFSGYSSIDEDFYEELEEILIMGDIGINATSAIIEHLKEQVAEKHIKNPMECKQLLINSIKEQMRVDSTEYEFENRKSVILVIGVNGVGKTTSVGKLAGKLRIRVRRLSCCSRYFSCSSGRTACTVGKSCRCGSDRWSGRR